MERGSGRLHVQLPLRRPLPNHHGATPSQCGQIAAAVGLCCCCHCARSIDYIRATQYCQSAGPHVLSGQRPTAQATSSGARRPVVALHRCRVTGNVHNEVHAQEELARGEEIAHCPSCSLTIVVIYNPVRCCCRYIIECATCCMCVSHTETTLARLRCGIWTRNCS